MLGNWMYGEEEPRLRGEEDWERLRAGEYKRYAQSQMEPHTLDAITWSLQNQGAYLTLLKIALEIFAILAISAEVKWIFS
ncbi:hypothetical protein RUND412_010417, partial [Rhizina undulata]